MKTTSATMLIASLERLSISNWKKGPARAAILLTAFICCAVVMFMAGRSSVSAQPELLSSFSALQLEVRNQQRMVDRLARQNELNINALAARLAELQAASTRMDALGQRLAQMGQLSLEEFDFSEPAPIGGPADYESVGSASELELRQAITSLGDKLRRQSSQLDTLQFLMMNRQLESDLTPTGWPVRKGWISSRFGERNDPFTGERVQHRGLDFAGTRGSEVLSVASGVVIWAASRTGYGSTVEIDHGNGYQTRYAHNKQLEVKPGDHVNAGQVIALMGDSGRASAPHVHFEVLHDGNRVNPSKFVGQLR
jgi:murein DD-endopeptidase MepM/ murein hydrolase activator NlpD